MSKLLNILAPAAVLLLAASCSRSSEWHVKGNVEGGADKTMLLEASSNGHWYPIDTVTIASNGSFEASQPAAGYPDIYRLNLDGKTIYFPIDSIETVTVSTKAGAFDTDYTVEGTASADMLMNVDNRIQQAINAHNSGDLTADTSLKHDLTETLLAPDFPTGGELILDPAARPLGNRGILYHLQERERTAHFLPRSEIRPPHYRRSCKCLQREASCRPTHRISEKSLPEQQAKKHNSERFHHR